MGMKRTTEQILVLGLAFAFVGGCASTPEEEQAQQQEQEQTGPNEATTEAIDEARTALDEARDAGAEKTQPIASKINTAESAGAEGNNARAQRLAREAERAANEAKKKAMAAAEKDKMSTMTYTVTRGDTLWGISGKDKVYGDPYQWPLIFKHNSDKIEDADLIYPDQKLKVRTNPGDKAVEAAVEHAKNRGAWSLGKTEKADRQYLKKQSMDGDSGMDSDGGMDGNGGMDQ